MSAVQMKQGFRHLRAVKGGMEKNISAERWDEHAMFSFAHVGKEKFSSTLTQLSQAFYRVVMARTA